MRRIRPFLRPSPAPHPRNGTDRRDLRLIFAGRVACLVLLAGTACSPLPYRHLATRAAPPVEQEFVLTLGPIDLPAGVDHFEAPQPLPLQAAFPQEGWMRGFEIEVLDGSGDVVPPEVLHHVKLLLPQKRELFQPIALRLVGAGSETRSGRLAQGLGVPVAQGDSLLVTAMVHNPTDAALLGVNIRLRLQYAPVGGSTRPTEVRPFYLHATSLDEPSDYDLPPGYSERSSEWRPAVEGRIVALGAHLHQYGLHVRFEDAATGREIWRATPQVDEDGSIVAIPRRHFVWTRGPRLRPDRTYRVTAAYFNPTGDTIRGGGMGTIGGAVRTGGSWPERDPHDPYYTADLLRELSGDHGSGAHGHAGSHR